ncbi:Vacuolar protein-sorting-associated protein 36 [Neolecta irregularis DAH-3]|uniref:Vacuolar protein-sorting-associated protein 36 n=1 Tax=Neolecta irregularis (strain DAH-3) TaxID=1198029 RepID=A0A1U7LR19_NEOID|nr:Vacuolar protein-sorting-associated protein 36 [Neolecta irregularis DAH-3]|eukprot:OLL24961.1 Vacuolar protein-sorting-associated protein 36 [Neolecta irregularis DAH-3]
MDQWQYLNLSASGRPDFESNEQIVFIQSNVGLYNGRQKSMDYQHGSVYLTSRRICYVDQERPATHSLFIPLFSVSRFETSPGFLKSSAKITLYLAAPHKFIKIPPSSSWVCEICTFANFQSASVCANCGIVHLSQESNFESELSLRKTTPNGYVCPRCTFVNHPALVLCEICGATLILANLPLQLSSQDVISRSKSPTLNNGENEHYCKLSFRGGGDKPFAEKLKIVLAEREWEIEVANIDLLKISNDQLRLSTKQGAGITGLEKASETQLNQEATAMGTAFSDLEALMARAKEMVQLAESFASRLANSTDPEARAILQKSQQALGLSTPIVTKELVGTQDLYHAELARQVSEFLGNGIMEREGGVIGLVDLFAMYNRARGVDLISADDLVAACSSFENLHLPYRVKRFPSGVTVIRERKWADEVVVEMISKWVSELVDGVGAQDAAAKFGWSVHVATEELEMAEMSSVLCRDQSIQGVRFFKNLFSEL